MFRFSDEAKLKKAKFKVIKTYFDEIEKLIIKKKWLFKKILFTATGKVIPYGKGHVGAAGGHDEFIVNEIKIKKVNILDIHDPTEPWMSNKMLIDKYNKKGYNKKFKTSIITKRQDFKVK